MMVRPARTEDAADICRIVNGIIRQTLVTFTTLERSPQDVAAEIDRLGAAFQVAERDGQVIGFASFGPFRSGPGYIHTGEISIHLAPQARRQGIGRRLVLRLEEVAVDTGLHVLVAGISGANPAAVAFHAAAGFVQVGRMPQVGFKQGRWLDLILMQKILPPGPDGAPDSRGGAG